ncbi:hypothetical protein GCWU000324_03008 [Kingella oralis ATCC 51147]|uniref:Uncharacterized protein n=1 Tax=Kingella oralis ATCC 51147 TaxID=629741 RepID=C4GMS2_9NEIS|nr:hypothetical protein GCWU000324_03008 [Kingella oralis ATCC 51147]
MRPMWLFFVLCRAVEIFSGCLLQSGAGFYNIGHSEFSQTAFSGCLAAAGFCALGQPENHFKPSIPIITRGHHVLDKFCAALPFLGA